jgi:hypothetical protein
MISSAVQSHCLVVVPNLLKRKSAFARFQFVFKGGGGEEKYFE